MRIDRSKLLAFSVCAKRDTLDHANGSLSTIVAHGGSGASTVSNLWKGGQPEKPSEFGELLKELLTSRTAIMVTHTAVDGMELDSVMALASTPATRTLRRKL